MLKKKKSGILNYEIQEITCYLIILILFYMHITYTRGDKYYIFINLKKKIHHDENINMNH